MLLSIVYLFTLWYNLNIIDAHDLKCHSKIQCELTDLPNMKWLKLVYFSVQPLRPGDIYVQLQYRILCIKNMYII